MLRSVFVMILLLVAAAGQAATYYFSSTEGNDDRTTIQAQQAATPWRSLQKLQQVSGSLQPGDSVLFRRGDIFFGSLTILASGNNSGWIVFSAYGNGNRPVISGFSTIANWRQAGNGIWQAAVAGAPERINMVLVNGSPEPLGRYPNKGYLKIEAANGASSILGGSLPFDANNAEVVIRKNHWVLDRNAVTATDGKTIYYTSESGYGAATDYGYFIQNHRATLDKTCEWYFTGTRLGMFFGSTDPSRFVVQASTTPTLARINRQSYLIFQDLEFTGANEFAFRILESHHIQIKNSNIRYTGNTAVRIDNSEHVWIEQVIIDQSNNIAVHSNNTGHVTLVNNTISNTGTVPGSGLGDSGSYEALLLSGDHLRVEENTILNTGYIPVTFNGNDITIRHNFIQRYGFVKDDGGGIYTWNNSANPPVQYNRTIDGNILLEGIGAPEGTADGKKLMHGIYMDDNASEVTIQHNTVAHCNQYGIYVHNAHHLNIDNNTLFNNQGQAALIHDHIAAGIPIRGIQFTNNILFSRTAGQPVALFKSIDDDLAVMGALDKNFYCRPLNEQTPIDASWKTGWSFFDLAGWQQFSGHDGQSAKTPVAIPAYTVSSLADRNKYPNGQFSSDISRSYSYAAAGNSAVSWSAANPLQGGALRVSFNGLSKDRQHASVIIGIGGLKKGQQYLLRYDAAGVTTGYIESYLRKSTAPYNDLSERQFSRVTKQPLSVEVLFTATASESDASIGLDIQEQPEPLYIDNLQLLEAQASPTDPAAWIRFVYNKTASPQAFVLDGIYTNVYGQVFSDVITLPPFRSAVLVKKQQLMAKLP